MPTKICSKCYRKVENVDGICPHCGADLNVEQIVPNTTGDEKELPDNYFMKHNQNRKVIIAILLVVVVSGILMVFFDNLPEIVEFFEKDIRAKAFELVSQGDYDAATRKVRFCTIESKQDVEVYIQIHKRNAPVLAKMMGTWNCEEANMQLTFKAGELGEGILLINEELEEGEFTYNLFENRMKIKFDESGLYKYMDFIFEGEENEIMNIHYAPNKDNIYYDYVFVKQS